MQSLRVAQPIDRRFTRNFQPAILEEFGKSLSQASGRPGDPAPAFLICDPVTTEVFSEAVQETSAQEIYDMHSVIDETRKIVASLINGGAGLSEKEFDAIKAFCLALHRSMMARRLPPLFEREASLDYEFRFTR